MQYLINHRCIWISLDYEVNTYFHDYYIVWPHFTNQIQITFLSWVSCEHVLVHYALVLIFTFQTCGSIVIHKLMCIVNPIVPNKISWKTLLFCNLMSSYEFFLIKCSKFLKIKNHFFYIPYHRCSKGLYYFLHQNPKFDSINVANYLNETFEIKPLLFENFPIDHIKTMFHWY
jgi:hypothetical protein